MKKTLFVAGGIALVASGLAYYFLSRAQKQIRLNPAADEHARHVAGEKMLRRAFRQSKQRAVPRG